MKPRSTAPSKRHKAAPLSLLRLALCSAAIVIIKAFVLNRRLDSGGGSTLLLPLCLFSAVRSQLWLRRRSSVTKGGIS